MSDKPDIELTGSATQFVNELEKTGQAVEALGAKVKKLQSNVDGVFENTKMASQFKALIGQGALFGGDALRIGITNEISKGIAAAFKSLDATVFQGVAKQLSQSIKNELSQQDFSRSLNDPRTAEFYRMKPERLEQNISKIGSSDTLSLERKLDELDKMAVAVEARIQQALSPDKNGKANLTVAGRLRQDLVDITRLTEQYQAVATATDAVANQQMQRKAAADDAEIKRLKERLALETKMGEKFAPQSSITGILSGRGRIEDLKSEAEIYRKLGDERTALARELQAGRSGMTVANLTGDPELIKKAKAELEALTAAVVKYKNENKPATGSAKSGAAGTGGVGADYVDKRFSAANAWMDANGGLNALAIQAKIGANFALLGAAMSGFGAAKTFVVDFEAELKNLQAITGATNVEAASLSKTFLDVATGFKFSSVEVAKAATIMAQAGMSPEQIQASIKSVAQLATATGTDLKTAVDIATSTMGAFNMTADQMGVVSNLVSAALNVSKLDAEKFALGLQYAGNVAADVGVSLADMTTSLAVMSNTGIRSGSTLGTGLRQVMEELVNPTDKFRAVLNRLGLGLDDIDVRAKGLPAVLKTLQNAGFTTADAFAAFGTRTSSAVASLMNGLDNFDNMRRAIVMGGDAASAANTQMDSLAGSWAKFANTSFKTVADGATPIMDAFKGILSVGTSIAEFLGNHMTGVATVLGTAFSVTAAMATRFTIALSIGALTSIRTGLLGLVGATEMVAVATKEATIWSTAFGKSNLVLVGLTAAIGVATYLWNSYSDSVRKTKEEQEALDTKLNEAKGAFDAQHTLVSSLQEEFNKLNSRYGELSKSGADLSPVISELNRQLKNTGFFASESGTSIDQLMQKLKDAEAKAREIEGDLAGRAKAAAENKKAATEQEIRNLGPQTLEDAGIANFGEAPRTQRDPLTGVTAGITLGDRVGAARISDVLKVLGTKVGEGPQGLEEARAERAVALRAILDLSKDLKQFTPQLQARIEKVQVEASRQVDLLAKPASYQAQADIYGNTQAKIDYWRDNPAAKAYLTKDEEIGKKQGLISETFTKKEGSILDLASLQREADAAQKAVEDARAVQAKLKADFPDEQENLKNFGLLVKLNNSISELEAFAAKRGKEYGTAALIELKAEKDRLTNELGLATRAHNEAQLHGDSNARDAASRLKIGLENQVLENSLKTAKANDYLSTGTKEGRQAALTNTSTAAKLANLTAQDKIRQDLEQGRNEDIDQQIASVSARADFLKTQMQGALTGAKSKFNKEEDQLALVDEFGKVWPQYIESLRLEAELTYKKTQGKMSEATRAQVRANSLAKIQEQADEFSAQEADTRTNINSLVKAMTAVQKDVNAKIEATTAALKEAELANHAPVAEAERAVYAAQGKFNTDGTAAMQLDAAQRNLKQVALPEEARSNIGALQVKIDADTASKASLDEQIKKLQDKKNLEQASPEEVDKLNESLKNSKKLDEEIVALKMKQLSTQGQLAKLEAEKDPTTLGEAVKGGWNQFATAEGLGKPTLTLFRDSLPSAFGAAKGAFATFTGDVLSRTKSISQAFRDMAKSILEAMAKLAMNQLVAGMFGSVLKLFGMGGGSDTVAPTTAADGNGFVNAGSQITSAPLGEWNGGFIRAAAGYTPSRTRDSVPILAAPGEMIMRQSAVDLIGADTLSNLNAQGNRRVSQSTPANANQSNDNKTPSVVNVWVVNKDQQPAALGPKDVMAIWTQDVLTGGQGKKLIKQVMAGTA